MTPLKLPRGMIRNENLVSFFGFCPKLPQGHSILERNLAGVRRLALYRYPVDENPAPGLEIVCQCGKAWIGKCGPLKYERCSCVAKEKSEES